jgi:DNA-binding transcriptional LysR family regulator
MPVRSVNVLLAHPMEMHQIRYFLAVSETLNLTKAAERCDVAQPSLTRAIKALETELGGELIRRERNLSHLTELGQRVLPMLRQCYETAASAKLVAEWHRQLDRLGAQQGNKRLVLVSLPR